MHHAMPQVRTLLCISYRATLILVNSMLHDKIMCNRTCSKTMICGHTCDQPCSVNHVCSCAIDQAGEVLYKATIDEEQVTESVDIQDMSEKEMQHEKMVNDYRDFANGKAQEQDERLNVQATATATSRGKGKGKRNKFVTKMSLVDLLDDDPSVNDSNPVYISSSGSSGNDAQRLEDSEAQGLNQSVPQWNLLD